jgi:hypothetical protein
MGPEAILNEEAVAAVARKSFDIAAAMIVERSERRRALPEVTFKPKDPPVF